MFSAYATRLALLSVALVLFSTSCTGRVEKATSAGNAAKAVKDWQGEKSSILVIAGQNFPEESEIASLLSWEYGLAEEKGRARVLYWPHSFEQRDSSLNLISSIAMEEAPDIVVTIGAPAGTLRELNRILSNAPKVKIASIFPSDEAIPTEAASNMVIDMDISSAEATSIEGEMIAEESTALDITPDEAAILLLAAVFSMEMINDEANTSSGPLNALLEEGIRFAKISAAKAGMKFASPSWELMQATDPDTGLRSRKHVLLRRAGS